MPPYLLLSLLLIAGLLPACRDLPAHTQTAAAPASDEGRAMVEAAQRVLTSLDPARRARTHFPFDTTERYNWHYLPLTGQRQGLPIEEMDAPQREAVFALLETALSETGAKKAHEIMALERVLHQLEGREAGDRYRNSEAYFLSIFGEPGPDAPWGWRYEGHHLSLNFSAIAGQGLAVTPAFYGSNPAQVRTGPHTGTEVLRAEQAQGRRLAQLFDSAQWVRVHLSPEAPYDLATTNARRVTLDRSAGLPGYAMTAAQRDSLAHLLKCYTGNMQPYIAQREWARMEAAGGLDSLYFAWAGSLAPLAAHYYRIHGPTLLIEYDNTQNDANHIHTVWRDPQNDFGEDLLHLHYQQAPASHGHDHPHHH